MMISNLARPHPGMCIQYVDDAAASVRFYAGLLGCEPVQVAPDFGLFVLDSGLQLGLWARDAVQPRTLTSRGGGAELAIMLADRAAVDSLYRAWLERGVAIAQAPVDLGFGRTFVGIDPDGNRIRVYSR